MPQKKKNANLIYRILRRVEEAIGLTDSRLKEQTAGRPLPITRKGKKKEGASIFEEGGDPFSTSILGEVG